MSGDDSQWVTVNLWWIFGLAAGAAILTSYIFERIRKRGK